MDYILPCVYAFLATLGFCIVFDIKKPSFLVVASAVGALGWLVFLLLQGATSEVLRYFFATIVVSLLAEVSARILKAPATVFLIPGIVPLVPGGGLYYTMTYLLDGDFPGFADKGIQTASYAAAIAAGVSIVTSLVRMFLWKRPGRTKAKNPATKC
jgi:uncharacterized membrane protein YjjB (DUF3815 family)